MLFSNTYSIPSGWAECNGQNGTPDLRGRFILGRGQGTGLSNRTYGDIDGHETHTLTTSEMPSHTHTIDACGNHIHTSNSGSTTVGGVTTVLGLATSDGTKTATETDDSGGE